MKAPYLPLYVKDWLCSRKVLAMPGPAVKAYVYLLCEAWRQDPRATLPNDDFELMSMARCEESEWMLIKPIVMERFFEDEKGRLCAKFAFELSCKMLTNQRPKNKNAHKSRINHPKNALLGNANAIVIAPASKNKTYKPYIAKDPKEEAFKKIALESRRKYITEKPF
jgi:uncharacterized protein YdaU (DUF1376 family)